MKHFVNKLALAGIFMMFFLNVNSVHAQIKTSMQEMLTSKTWEEQGEGAVHARYRFTRDSMKFFIVGNPAYANFDAKQAYYLSDFKDKTFNAAKIGKNPNGKYIIQQDLNTSDVYVMKIISINATEMHVEAYVPKIGRVNKVYRAVK